MRIFGPLVALLISGLLVAPVFARGGGHGGGGHSGGHSSGHSGSHAGSGHASATSSHTVRAYTTKKGTHVAAHRATNPDHTKANNWSTRGNVNPFTGKPGTKSPG